MLHVVVPFSYCTHTLHIDFCSIIKMLFYFVVSLPTVSGLEDRRVVAVGANTVLSVEAEGVSLSFQWQHVSAHEMKQEQQEAEGLGADPCMMCSRL